jgi:hypothetical protein
MSHAGRLVVERRLAGREVGEWPRAWLVGDCEVVISRGSEGYKVAIEAQSGREVTGDEIEIAIQLIVPEGVVLDFDGAEFEMGVLVLNQRKMDD